MLRIISLNIAGGKHFQERKEAIAEVIKRENPDLVFLQEVRLQDGTTQANILNKLLEGLFSVIKVAEAEEYHASTGQIYREGLGVLSKNSLQDYRIKKLLKPVGDKHQRIAQCFSIVFDNNKYNFTHIHLSNNIHSSRQLREVYEQEGRSAVILGDFNIPNISMHKDVYQKTHLSSTEFVSYVSFPAKGETLDYILLPRCYSFEKISVLERLSDHNGLLFSFKLK